MTNFPLKIEDYSPVLQYSTQWRTGGSAGNGDAELINSFTLTNTQGSYMSFVYYGLGIQIYGAKRSNHGNYRVVVDNGTYSYDGTGFSSNDTFQQSLFNYSTPTENWHNVTITNEENNKYLDIDFITLQSTIGNENENLSTTNFDDGHPAFTYFPPSSWTTNPPNQSDYFEASGQYVKTAYRFRPLVGDAVTLYGPIHPDGASYFAVLDGGASFQSYTTDKTTPQSKVLMYQAFHLGPGQHNLTISYAPSPFDASQNQPFLAIDYATVYTTASGGGGGVYVLHLPCSHLRTEINPSLTGPAAPD
ncbi:hypothetical protein BDQ17DRAFT_1250442 [Cyathus striatus]|nr:hypothetical protein BDQ17DRAFT_1250442 [Cyathus striatus]